MQYYEADCPPGDTGCADIEFHPPLMAPQSLVYLIYPPGEGGPKGGRITVVNRDGTVRSGWPKTLQRPGATWDSVTIGENRRAYAVAVSNQTQQEAFRVGHRLRAERHPGMDPPGPDRTVRRRPQRSRQRRRPSPRNPSAVATPGSAKK